MKRPISFKPFTGLLAALFVICLAGCKEDITLLDDNGKVIGKGMLEITANFPSPAHLTLAGKKYTGFWNVEKIYEEGLARSRHLISDRAFAAYEIGNDPDQLKHGRADLSSADGSKIQCDFYYRSQPGTGSCDVGGRQLILRVQRPGYS